MIAGNGGRYNPSKAAGLGAKLAACGIKHAKAPCPLSSRVQPLVIASLRSDLRCHLLSSRVCEAIPTFTLQRLLHFVRNDNGASLSSRVCEAISTFTLQRLLHFVRNDNGASLSSRVYEAISTSTLLRLLHFVRNDNSVSLS